MKTLLISLIASLLLAGCSSKQNQQDSIKDVPAPKTDSAKILLNLWLHNPLRALSNFDIDLHDPAFNQTIKKLSESKRTQITLMEDSCLGDCCTAYKELKDDSTKIKAYIFKSDCGEYGLSNDQYLLINDTLEKLRSFSIGIKEWPTDSTSTVWIMKESLIFLGKQTVTVKEREKAFTVFHNFNLNDLPFNEHTESVPRVLMENTAALNKRLKAVINPEP